MSPVRLILFLFFILPGPVFAQPCSCVDQFDWLRQKLAVNYSGYRDKVNPSNQAGFDAHTAAYRQKAEAVSADTACLRLLREWAGWFHDGHVQIGFQAAAADRPEDIRQRFADWETVAFREAEARAYLSEPGRDPVEGIYRADAGNYRVALVKNSTAQRDYAAIVLQADSVWWMPGQIKFDLKSAGLDTYTSRYYMRDHSEQNPKATLDRGVLRLEGLGAWYRQYPGPPVAIVAASVFTLQVLDSVTVLITVPTMNEGVRLELDSLIKANKTLLDRTPNLIVDCRNNGGGSDITYYPLKPYVYTGSVKGYPTQTYATEDNLQKYEKLRRDKSFPKRYRLYFGRMARKMRRNLGQFVGKCKEETERFRKVNPNPRQVAVLINGGCASSCEQFVYYARQSKRVTLIGQNTAGILDYGNLHTLEFPCPSFSLAYPTSRSCRVDVGQALDGTGMSPDIRLEEAGEDWVAFARRYLRDKAGAGF